MEEQHAGTQADDGFTLYTKRKKGRKKSTATTPRGNEEVLVVKATGKSFAEILKEVKSGETPANVIVTSMRQGRNEELLIGLQTKGQAVHTEDLRKTIAARIPEVVISSRTRESIIHVKGMDGQATVEEIQNSIAKETKVDSTRIRVTSLRPAFRGTQNATVRLPEKVAVDLIARGKIQIGWVSCRVQLRETQNRCYRCWEMGHRSFECKGPDRGKLCFRCGKQGHQHRDCKAEQHCIKCDSVGHQMGDSRCTTRDGPKNGSTKNTAA